MPMTANGSQTESTGSAGLVDAARYQLVQRLMDSLLHDARNPLNALAINLDVLTEKLRGPDRQVPPSQEKNLKAMRDQVFRVDGILRTFADFMAPKGVALGGAPASEPPPFTDRVARALEVLGHELRRNRITLRQMLEPNVQLKGTDVPAQNFLPLQAVIRAIARSQQGGEISVTLTADGDQAILKVVDSTPDAQEPFQDAAAALALEAERLGGEASVKAGECVLILPTAGS